MKVKKDDIMMFNICMPAHKMLSLINKSADWPHICHKTARTFPKSSTSPHSMNKLTLNEPAIMSKSKNMFVIGPKHPTFEITITKEIETLIMRNFNACILVSTQRYKVSLCSFL